jgi:hypothetical protein
MSLRHNGVYYKVRNSRNITISLNPYFWHFYLPVQLPLQVFDKLASGRIVSPDLSFDGLPRSGAILVFHVHQPVDYPVYLLLIFLGNFEPDFIENILQVSEIAGHTIPPYTCYTMHGKSLTTESA